MLLKAMIPVFIFLLARLTPDYSPEYICSSNFSFYKADSTELYLDTTHFIGKQIDLSWETVPLNERPTIFRLDSIQFDVALYEKCHMIRDKNYKDLFAY